MSKKILITVILVLSIPLFVHAQEGPQIFGAEPAAQEQSKGRNIASCLAGWRQFLAAGIGYESFKDYFRDFLLWSMHYADVANIENQLNKSRYSLMSAYLRCDLRNLESVTDAYYKLEAELYFIRHYVNTGGGFLKILTENIDDRKKFKNDMMDYLVLRKKSTDPEKDRALFGGYFDLFNEKYKERAKEYKSFGSDPAYKELSHKFDQLVETFKSFGKIGGEMEKSAGQTPENANQAKSMTAEPALANAPPKSIKEKAANFISKFVDACVSTDDNRYCLLGESKTTKDPFAQSGQISSSQKKPFEDVIIAITKQELTKTEDLTKAQMLARYELLYGDVNGQGIASMLKKMNKLESILTNGDTKDPANIINGSLEPLKGVAKCAAYVLARQCK